MNMKYIIQIVFVFVTIFAFGQNNIAGYEYWFDDDFSGKVTTPVAPVTQLSLNTNVSTSSLNTGVHTISIRSWDENGEFSSILTQFFYKIPEQALAATKEIVAYEYWFNDDYGNAVSQTVTNQAVYNLSTLVSTASINTGVHSFSIRFKDNADLWSSVLTQFFYKVPEQAVAATKELVEYEYWFDNDYASAVVLPIANQQVYNLSSLISTTSINTGVHSLSIRFKDNTNLWSSVLTQFFYKTPASATSVTKEIVAYEYWFDNDYASAVVTPVANQTIYNLNSLISASALNNGVHTLSIRFQDNADLWSSVLTQFFYKMPEQPILANNLITDYRYWFDADFAGAANVSLASPVHELNLIDNLDLTQLPHGMHSVHFQFKDSVQLWSSVTTDSVEKIALPIADFSISSVENCDSTVITMTDNSVDADEYLWDFGGGNTSALQEPEFTFYSAGVYPITLTVTDTILFIDSTITAYVTIYANTTAVQDVTDCSDYLSPSGLYTWNSSGTYFDTIPNAFGCDSLITVNLTLNSTTSSFMETACFTYTAPDAMVYTSSGIYTAIIPNAAGCDSTISIDLTINTVDVGVTQNVFELTADASLASYQWLDCNDNYALIPGETAQTFTATSNGSYAVRVNQNGCADTSSCYVISTIGVYENSDFTSIAIYPNPTNGKVHVKFGKKLNSVTYSLLDPQGRVISQNKMLEIETFDLDIIQPPGVYFIRIVSDDIKSEFKIVKN